MTGRLRRLRCPQHVRDPAELDAFGGDGVGDAEAQDHVGHGRPDGIRDSGQEGSEIGTHGLSDGLVQGGQGLLHALQVPGAEIRRGTLG